tara:strand:- start:84 stop:278 length:195 start_codon:yes stop_codon:yes gene_type:complete
MNKETDNNSKVISIFDRIPKKDEIEESDLSFEEIAKRNLENRERMRRDRAKANKGVIRSYRLKK